GTGWAANTDRVPDAAAITPPVADPALGPVNPISLTVALDPGFAVAGIDSPYHEITVEQRGGGRFTVSLAAGGAWADRDFELVWRSAAGAEPTAALFSETVAGEDFHLMMIMPPHRPAAAETTALPREIVFVIDTSGSMAGTSIVQARQALLYALGRLDGADRFNIIAFNDRPRPLFGAARPADDKALALGRRFVDALVANHGTEMRPALELALSGDGAEGGAIRQVVFITDGSVGNEAELFGVIHDRLGDRRLFTVGIGSAPNSHFMREAAEIGRGSFTYIGAAGEVGDKMAALFARLENPALTDIAIVWPGGATPEAYPATVPDLYLGEPIVVAVRLPRGTGGRVTLSGRDAGAAWTETVTLAPDRPAPGIAALWARAKIAELERARYRGADPAETRRRILEVALAHGLVSAYTSLVAVDDAVVRPDGATLGTDPVATNMPHGVAMQFAAASLDAIRAMAETGSPYRVTRLPNTATPAQANLIFGLVCLILAAGLFWMARRMVRFAP
ncbi:MAG: VWA domain-containing protein, partial [Alphaproteobacteria bacterium]